MAKEQRTSQKFDPNTEAFQMRAQWKKADNCRKQWFDQWSWLLDERKKTLEETERIKNEAAKSLPTPAKPKVVKNLKPIPVTSTGFIGWLANKPDCQLEIYTSWLEKERMRLPDAWEEKGYVPVWEREASLTNVE